MGRLKTRQRGLECRDRRRGSAEDTGGGDGDRAIEAGARDAVAQDVQLARCLLITCFAGFVSGIGLGLCYLRLDETEQGTYLQQAQGTPEQSSRALESTDHVSRTTW